ncbi:fanconi-associated nuclease 1-like isoform X2 [Hydractinia symbiolongicarpus]|uniref:fanconi-associated nuclease 1-like isoform X2 n=1 Tax=Hydractinia symbiolongicarpus TaxID=13093 RepID=UPI00254A8C22|nr:fanconi-associated nuclease 1-like isoform X2 [Hydractinia symbiolongicarpus]
MLHNVLYALDLKNRIMTCKNPSMIVISDDSEEDIEKPIVKSHIENMRTLTTQLKNNSFFSPEKTRDTELMKWRMMMNPFRSFGYSSGREKNVPKFNCCTSSDVAERESSEVGEDSLYYHRSFLRIIDTVADNNINLFDDRDMRILQQFRALSSAAQKLYIRLYQRKKQWFRCDKISYPNISEDLKSVLHELVTSGHLENSNRLTNFKDVITLLTLNEIRLLGNHFRVTKGKSAQSKEVIIQLLKKHCQKQPTLLSLMQKKPNSMPNEVVSKAKRYIGDCVMLNEDATFFYSRICTFFSLTTLHYEDIMHNSGHNLLYHLLQKHNGSVKYATYKMTKHVQIFAGRQELVDYTKAKELEIEFDMAMEKKDCVKAENIYNIARNKLLQIIDTYDNTKPYWICCFTELWIITRICTNCVDLLEKQRKYDEAVVLIKLLLAQKNVCLASRGGLWERLAIDIERHQKKPLEALTWIREAFNDPFVRTGHRYGLLQRRTRLKKQLRCNLQENEEVITDSEPETLSAEIFLDSSSAHRAVFRSTSTNSSDYSLSHVEQHVILHYQQNGFPHGIHGESATVLTLFCLLFWDIIFMDVADVFHSDMQSSPLDIYRDEFYTNRKKEVDDRLSFVYSATEKELQNAVTSSWQEHYGISCTGANWELFSSSTEAAGLAVCLGATVLGGICELFCKDLRRRRGGFPDLIVWNVETKQCRIIEVKGPGDKLSTKQIVWLDVLRFFGADAVVCNVRGTGGKRKHLSD